MTTFEKYNSAISLSLVDGVDAVGADVRREAHPVDEDLVDLSNDPARRSDPPEPLQPAAGAVDITQQQQRMNLSGAAFADAVPLVPHTRDKEKHGRRPPSVGR